MNTELKRVMENSIRQSFAEDRGGRDLESQVGKRMRRELDQVGDLVVKLAGEGRIADVIKALEGLDGVKDEIRREADRLLADEETQTARAEMIDDLVNAHRR